MRDLYILACDERGTRNWPSSSNTWAFGGYIIKKSIAKELINEWEEIKIKLCGNPNVELKWSHFFPGNHQTGNNPLIAKKPIVWKKQLFFALDKLCSLRSFTPVTLISRKHLIPKEEYEEYFEISSKGNYVLQVIPSPIKAS